MNVDYQLIGARIKQKRKQAGLTQERLAEAAGVSVGYISQIERGITHANLEMLASICGIVHCDLCYLFSGTEKKDNPLIDPFFNEKIRHFTPFQKKLLERLIDAIAEMETGNG